MNNAVIVDAVRTPAGKFGGALSSVRPDDLGSIVIKALIERNGLDPGIVEEVIFGNANQAGEDNRNIARMCALLAGLPVETTGVTVNRLCGSGMQAVADAARLVELNEASAVIAGGVESMSRAPYVIPKSAVPFERGDKQMVDTTLGWRFVNPLMKEMYFPISLGETAEVVAEQYGITREEQDAFALSSQRKTKKAMEAGAFDREIVPVEVTRKKEKALVRQDEPPRPDVTMEDLQSLPPVFKKQGTVTAGNSSGLNDGASALLIMHRKKAQRLGLKPLAVIRGSAIAGVHPDVMGIGPVPATRKLLQRLGLSIQDIDLFELNEAFASQSVAAIKQLSIDPDKVNVNGGAIALGHALGSSGSRILTTLVHELHRRKGARFGLATMCIGVGQGITTLIEKDGE